MTGGSASTAYRADARLKAVLKAVVVGAATGAPSSAPAGEADAAFADAGALAPPYGA